MKRLIASPLLALVLLLGACAQGEPAEDMREPLPVLDGRYSTSIPGSDFRAVKAPKSNGGPWTLEIGKGMYTVEGAFRVTENIQVTGANTLTVSDVPAPAGAFNCFDEDGDRLMPPEEVVATYTFVSKDEVLELTADEEPCPYRELLLARRWTVKG